MPDPTTAAAGPRVLVCGARGLGVRVIEQLAAAGAVTTVLDDAQDPALGAQLGRLGVRHVVGDARDPASLHRAGLAEATALLCLGNDDLHTVEVALLAHELRPELRVVARVGNPAVGRAMSEVLGTAGVLDVASLAAPSVVEACLAAGAHPLQVAGREFVVAALTCPSGGSLRALFGDLTPLAVQSPGVPGAVVCPPRDHVVQAGDVVTVLGIREELAQTGLPWGRAREAATDVLHQLRPGRAWPGGRRPDWAPSPVRLVAGALARLVDRRLRLVLLGLAVLVVVSATVLRLGYRDDRGGMSTLDALYFTVETIGTVGFGDFFFRDQAAWLRVYAIALMFVGAMLATVFFAMLTNLLVSRRIEESLGRRKVPGLAGHTVVVGVGAVGVRVVESLVGQGHEVVVVERDDDNRYLGQVRALGVPVILGDSTLASTLEQANLRAAGAVAVLTSDDLTNLETGLAVRDLLGPRWLEVPVVLRLFDRQLARTVETAFGFAHVRSTAALAAPWFAGAALGLDVLATFYVGRHPLLVARLAVAPGDGLDGVAMTDLGAAVRVVALRRGGPGAPVQHPVRRDVVLAGGDDAYLVGPYEEMLALVRRAVGGPGPGTKDRVPVAG